MELSDYELVRYPSGQLIITRIDANSRGFRDVVGVYANEADAQRALSRLIGASNARTAPAEPAATQHG
jgi:hypothetical protein